MRRATIAGILLVHLFLAACSQGTDTTVAPQKPDLLPARLMFVGDVMLSRNVARFVSEKAGGDFAHPFLKTASILREADVAFGNLECPISGRGEKLDKKYVFNAPPSSLKGLVFAGFDVLSLANNHVLDYGTVALEDTTRLLSQTGIKYVGLMSEEPQSGQVTQVFTVRGLRIGYLAYADPSNEYSYPALYKSFPVRPAEADPAVISADIAALKDKADVVVVSMHWGIEYQAEPTERQRNLGKSIIDAGARVVAGHHPHFLQPIERYKDGIIIYSLGNFVFDQYTRPLTRQSRIVEVLIGPDRQIAAVNVMPVFVADGWQPTPKADHFEPLSDKDEVPNPGSDKTVADE